MSAVQAQLSALTSSLLDLKSVTGKASHTMAAPSYSTSATPALAEEEGHRQLLLMECARLTSLSQQTASWSLWKALTKEEQEALLHPSRGSGRDRPLDPSSRLWELKETLRSVSTRVLLMSGEWSEEAAETFLKALRRANPQLAALTDHEVLPKNTILKIPPLSLLGRSVTRVSSSEPSTSSFLHSNVSEKSTHEVVMVSGRRKPVEGSPSSWKLWSMQQGVLKNPPPRPTIHGLRRIIREPRPLVRSSSPMDDQEARSPSPVPALPLPIDSPRHDGAGFDYASSSGELPSISPTSSSEEWSGAALKRDTSSASNHSVRSSLVEKNFVPPSPSFLETTAALRRALLLDDADELSRITCSEEVVKGKKGLSSVSGSSTSTSSGPMASLCRNREQRMRELVESHGAPAEVLLSPTELEISPIKPKFSSNTSTRFHSAAPAGKLGSHDVHREQPKENENGEETLKGKELSLVEQGEEESFLDSYMKQLQAEWIRRCPSRSTSSASFSPKSSQTWVDQAVTPSSLSKVNESPLSDRRRSEWKEDNRSVIAELESLAASRQVYHI